MKAPQERGREENMLPVVIFVGNSGAGKTSILEKVVRELKGRGYRVAVIKHVHHGDFEVDHAGKDSWRFTQAGCDSVIIASSTKVALIERRTSEPPWDDLVAMLDGRVDIVLGEGFGGRGKPEVLVVRGAQPEDPAHVATGPLAIVSDQAADASIPRFDFDEVPKLTDFLLAHLQLSLPPDEA